MTELTSALQQRSSTTMMMMRKTRDVLDVDNNVNNVNQHESIQYNNKTTSRNRNRTNNRWSRKSGWKTNVLLLLIPLLVVLLLLLILIVIVIDHYYQQQPIKQQQHPLLQNQSIPPPHLFPQICSHQLLNPPPLLSSSPSIKKTINDGSLDAMTALWYEGGITCFDIDVVVLSDGTMLATHPKRITAAISKALEQQHQQQQNNNNDDKEEKERDKDVIKIEEYTVDSIYDLLLLSSGGGEEEEEKKKNNSPFPIFDTELLPQYADLVHTTITNTSNTSSPRGQQQVHHHQQEEEVIVPPWMLRGPLLNIDLKLGPYLTENRVLELIQSITDLGLEDYIAICVSPPEAYDNPSSSSSLNLWEILHGYNNDRKMEMETEKKKKKKKIIPLGLVLRDLVPDEKNVNRIQQLVSQDNDLYKSDSDSDSGVDAGADANSGGSIKLLIPSFKFEKEWYNTIRGEVANRSSENENENDSAGAILLRRLPMTVWTIDTIQDYHYVTSMTTTNGIVMASAVVANNPMQIIEQAITAKSITARRRGQNR